MSTSVLLGLTLQAMALVIMHIAVRGQWLRHAGATLLAAAAVYHGLTELLAMLAPGYNRTRPQVEQSALDFWVLLVSATLLVYAVGYALVLRTRSADLPGRTPDPQSGSGPGLGQPAALRGLSLGWLAAAALPLIYLCLQGRGVVQSGAIDAKAAANSDHYLTAGLATQFLVFVVALTSLALLARIGARWLLPVLALQSILLAFVGIRAMIVVAGLLVVAEMTRVGLRYPRRSLVAALLLMGLIGMTVSSTRAVAGRDAFQSDRTAGQRLVALTDGLTQIGSAQSRRAIVADLVPRFDANTFGSLVLQSLREGARPVGMETTRNNLFLAVPSFLNPGKQSEPLERRNEDFYFVRHFGLHYGTDYLPGLFGFLLGYHGPVGLPILAGLLAAVLARADRWLAARASRTRLLAGLGLLQAAILYTNLPSGFLLIGRGVLVIIVISAALALLGAERTGTRQLAPPTARPAHPTRTGWSTGAHGQRHTRSAI